MYDSIHMKRRKVLLNQQSYRQCLKHVSRLKNTIFAKRLATTREGRRRVSRIYKKLKLSKDDREEVSSANKRRLQYDQDGRGEERFLETILLMLREVKNCSSASKQVVSSAMHNAFRISLGKFLLLYFCLFLVCIFVEVLYVAYLIFILNWFCSENLLTKRLSTIPFAT